ncbi:MAG: hypothetical protein IJ875_04895, partial [Solobacterium sp.]|nr:hypothetical protein [Solobacterium sp.]
MKRMRLKKRVYLALLPFLVALGLVWVGCNQKETIINNKIISSVNHEGIVLVDIKKEPSYNYSWSNTAWQMNEDINEDYIATIRFESGLIDLPVVQGPTNDTYLRTDWKDMSFDDEGSIFFDYENV